MALNYYPGLYHDHAPIPAVAVSGGTARKASRVAILLALFDGARYLGDQLESIARQTHRNWSLSIRDDGSRDMGVRIARDFSETVTDQDIRIWGGSHRGFARNFLAMVEAADADADYVAYADQDDVWDPEKLARAVAHLSRLPAGAPALYCGPTIITNTNLTPIGRSPEFRQPPSFRNALVQSIAGGNTMVANRAALDLLRVAAGYRGPLPAHDWWTYQVVTGAGGTVIFDDRPMVLYRQHDGNMIGSNRGAKARARRLKALANGQLAVWSEQNIAALTAVSPLLTKGNNAILRDFAELRTLPVRARLKRLAASGLHRQTRAGQAALWVAAATGRI